MGRLSLSLRSLAKDDAELERLANLDELPFEAETEKGTTHTFTSEVSRLIPTDSLLDQDRIQVIRGGRTTELRFKKGKLVDSVSLDPDPQSPAVGNILNVPTSAQLTKKTDQAISSAIFAKEQ